MRCYEHGGDIYGLPDLKLDFSVNLHPLGLPQGVKEALSVHSAEFTRYPDPDCGELRETLWRYIVCTYPEISSTFRPENILFGNGASDLIFRICAALHPKKVLIPAPTFSEYERTARLFGKEVRFYDMPPCTPGETDCIHEEREAQIPVECVAGKSGFVLAEDFLTQLTDDTDLVFLCNPNNPTGKLIDHGLLEKIIRLCDAKKITLVIDECFLQFTEAASMITCLSSFHRLLILNAFTKYYGMAGLRLGYLCGDAAYLKKIAGYGPQWNVSIPAQIAGIASLADEPEWTKKTRSLIRTERAYMTKELTDLGLTIFSSEANFLLIQSDRKLFHPLADRGFLVRNCENFRGLDDSYIRIGLKTRPENESLLSAVKEVLHG